MFLMVQCSALAHVLFLFRQLMRMGWFFFSDEELWSSVAAALQRNNSRDSAGGEFPFMSFSLFVSPACFRGRGGRGACYDDTLLT
jgi:hypothetical protein